MVMRLLLAATAAVALGAPAAPLAATWAAPGDQASVFSTDDLLGMENFGKVRVTPDGRWTIVERQARWDSAATYRFNSLTSHLLSRLEVFRDGAEAPVITLADPGGATGYVSGPLSPDGQRMVVYRLTSDSWRLGVLVFGSGEVDWFDVTPEYPRLGQTVAWRSNRDLVLIARPLDDLPLFLRYPGMAQDRITALWRDAAAGHQPSAVYIPSGPAGHRYGRRDQSGARRVL